MIPLSRTASGIIAVTLRVALGGFFLWSGAEKLRDLPAFLASIRSFHILDDPYAAWLAMGLPWLEILAGTALVTGFLVEGGLALIAGMLAVFLWAIVYSWQRGLNITCGCFGAQAESSTYTELIVRDALLLTLAAALLLHRRRQER